jgi:hypothetical protein
MSASAKVPAEIKTVSSASSAAIQAASFIVLAKIKQPLFPRDHFPPSPHASAQTVAANRAIKQERTST